MYYWFTYGSYNVYPDIIYETHAMDYRITYGHLVADKYTGMKLLVQVEVTIKNTESYIDLHIEVHLIYNTYENYMYTATVLELHNT